MNGDPVAQQEACRHFLDLSGRSWKITALEECEARRLFPGELFFEDPPTVSLLFLSDDERRAAAHGPAHWQTLSYTALSELFNNAKPVRLSLGQWLHSAE